MSSILEQAEKIRAAMDGVTADMTDEEAENVAALFMPWKADTAYETDERVRYSDLLYKCLQGHTSQADWTPDAAVSLWVQIDDPAIEWPEWRQPTGAHDAYALGAKVSHNEKHWISLVDANVWEPGEYGWEEQA